MLNVEPPNFLVRQYAEISSSRVSGFGFREFEIIKIEISVECGMTGIRGDGPLTEGEREGERREVPA